MRQLTPPRFVPGSCHLASLLETTKQYACPRCGRGGTLNGHGLLRGYGERTAHPDQIRGRRLLCSNRGRRQGCGRTFSVLVASRIPSFVVSTKTLLAFVVAMLAGLSRRAAWIEAVDDAMSTRSGYRLWTRLTFALSMLRTRLCREAPPPACAHTEPIAQLLEHVAAVCTPALGAPDDAFANAQLHFQRGLFD